MNKIFAPFLPPWVETGLQPAFYDMESGTVLQQTARMYAKVQQLTRLFNELSEETKTTVEEYIAKFNVLAGKFIELKDFVEDYFDNLDVQEEINNKLDAMAEDGTLEDILQNHIFNNLKVNDNYVITTEKVVDSDNTLEYHITRISPNTDKTSHVEMKAKMCADTLADSALTENKKNLFQFSQEINSVFASNADSAGSLRHCVVIRDGVVLRQSTSDQHEPVCGFDKNGVLKAYADCTSSDPLVADGIQNTWGCSILVKNGAEDQYTWQYTDASIVNNQHPRTIMLQENGSKDVVFLHVSGRKPSSTGLTFAEASALVLELFPTVETAVIFGGGGDTQLMIEGRMMNDSNDNQLRTLYDIIYLDPNLDYDEYNEASLEIANARNSATTMHDMLSSRLNLTDNYKYADKIMQAEVIGSSETYLNLICNVDYNVVLETGDAILVKVPDLSSYNAGAVVTMNIHYAGEINQPTVQHEDGTAVQPMEISNQIRLFYWNNGHYIVKNEQNLIKHISANVETDINNYMTTGSYFSENFQNKPSTLFNNAETGFLKVYQMPTRGVIVQQYFTEGGRIYERTYQNSVWNNWQLMMTSAPNAKNGVDNNNLGINIIGYGNNMTNKPTGASNGWIINLAGGTAGYNAQIYIERETGGADGRMFLRLQENNVWKNWKQISFEA